MTETELNSIAEGWIRYQLAAEGSPAQAENWNSVSKSLDIRSDVRDGGDPKILWELIVAIHSRDQSDDVRIVLAAGPLEDLLAYRGPDFIEEIEQKASSDPTFARLLRGVYRRSMSDDLWNRVVKISGWQRQMNG